ncbi:hypothetical protein ACEPPN_001344 [Leptodophora sp. 'Broadleaf-Isolate-01']
MPRASRSKRLQGLAPDTDEISKRARKPNTNSLEAFTRSQEPISRKSKGRKRARASTIGEEDVEDTTEVDDYTEEPVEDAAEEEPSTPNPRKGKDRTDATIELSSAVSTPSKLPHRKKQVPAFDPTDNYGPKLTIGFVVTVSIDGRAKNSFLLYEDINSRDRLLFAAMGALVYKKRVEGWADTRGLKGADRPEPGPWVITSGDPKKQGICTELTNEDDLRDFYVFLRQ